MMHVLGKAKQREWMNRIILEDVICYTTMKPKYPLGYSHNNSALDYQLAKDIIYGYLNKIEKAYIHNSIMCPLIYEFYRAGIEIQSTFKTNLYPINGRAADTWVQENLPGYTKGGVKMWGYIYAPQIRPGLGLFKKPGEDISNRNIGVMGRYSDIVLGLMGSGMMRSYIIANKDYFVKKFTELGILYVEIT